MKEMLMLLTQKWEKCQYSAIVQNEVTKFLNFLNSMVIEIFHNIKIISFFSI